ncbi:MAG: amino acid ABC transporter permease, partial [Promicromonosporaceae bacterium]|nr:amino acid ABC transporter permease [Promicromonosporaceae bacterium]
MASIPSDVPPELGPPVEYGGPVLETRDQGDFVIPNRINARPVPRPGRIVLAIVLIALVAAILWSVAHNPTFRWDLVWLYLRDVVVIRGVFWTLILTFGSMLLGSLMAVILAVLRRGDNPVSAAAASLFIFLFRGTPVYVQLVFWGLLAVLYPTIGLRIPFGPELFSVPTSLVLTGFWAALLGLAFNEAAYLSEIVRAGLDSIDPGQEEAARALGLTSGQTMRKVILPQAMRVIIPPAGNETISMLKTTSLVIAVPFTLDLF